MGIWLLLGKTLTGINFFGDAMGGNWKLIWSVLIFMKMLMEGWVAGVCLLFYSSHFIFTNQCLQFKITCDFFCQFLMWLPTNVILQVNLNCSH